MPRMIVKLDGECFYGKRVAGDAAESVAALYQCADTINRINLELEDGRWLVLPVEAARRAAFIVEPDPAN